MQTEINEAGGLTFAKAARHLLRQDPQVLVIGEIRDEETANIVVRAALTGHMVIATLHAGSCRGVLERLLVLCADKYSAISALELVLNQRLVRRLCADCRGAGCEACLGTGYRGRIPIVEWMTADEAVRNRVRSDGPEAVQPRVTLAAAARELLRQNLSDEKEIQRVLGLSPTMLEHGKVDALG
jgi:type II secretory ATPase GspE/PulE/Tfp pilus assembly ATPase PilB-like protein